VTTQKQSKLKGCAKGCGISVLVVFGVMFILIILALLIPDTNKDLFDKATKELSENHTKEADSIVDVLIKKDSLNNSYYFLKSKIAYAQKDTLAVKRHIENSISVLKNDSEKYKFLNTLAAWNLTKNDTLASVKNLLTSLSFVRKDSIKAYENKIFKISEKFIELKSDTSALRLIQDYENLISLESVDTSHFKRANHLISDYYFKLDNPKKAIATLSKTIDEVKTDTTGFQKLAEFYQKEKQNTKAISYYKKVVNLDSSNVSAYNKIASLYIKNKRKKSAIKYYRVAANKGSSEACENLRELTAKTKYYTRSVCCDGTTSGSTGRGTCSHHGGVCGYEKVPYKEYTIRCD
jgi:tetratricopeptide (TPR) repeat protein